MTITGLLVHDVTISTPTTTEDRYGNDVKTSWTSSTVKGWISQRSQIEDRERREAQVSEWVLFLLPDATISGAARVAWEGITFEVDGPANPAWSRRGAHHLEVPLRVVAG